MEKMLKKFSIKVVIAFNLFILANLIFPVSLSIHLLLKKARLINLAFYLFSNIKSSTFSFKNPHFLSFNIS